MKMSIFWSALKVSGPFSRSLTSIVTGQLIVYMSSLRKSVYFFHDIKKWDVDSTRPHAQLGESTDFEWTGAHLMSYCSFLPYRFSCLDTPVSSFSSSTVNTKNCVVTVSDL
jgi:hypothetical protein